ncbi:MAG TPA: sulfurtransferase [Bryobacteraceae bacterium]|nr:sulfurtransferase [Bryobacteraceae bacterium]
MTYSRTLRLFLVIGLQAATAFAAPCGGHGDKSTMLVSTAWLADHLHDPNLTILAIGPEPDYQKAHIPGALYLSYDSIHLMQTPANLTVELPPMDQLRDVFRKLGVNNDSHVVLYFGTQRFASIATRAYLTLDAMGMGPHTSLLDGGLPVWQSEGRATTTEVRPVTAGKLEPCPQNDIIAELDYVRSNLRHPGVAIIDARAPEFYTGAQIPNGKRAGHIPGATNIAYTSLLDAQGKLKSPEALKDQFTSAGIKPGDRVVSYCHIGQQATVVYFAARYLGYDARLYDGSWEDWSAHKELPAETSTAK